MSKLGGFFGRLVCLSEIFVTFARAGREDVC
jgi:hypothetical protein